MKREGRTEKGGNPGSRENGGILGSRGNDGISGSRGSIQSYVYSADLLQTRSTFDSSDFSTQFSLISMSVVLHRGGGEACSEKGDFLSNAIL